MGCRKRDTIVGREPRPHAVGAASGGPAIGYHLVVAMGGGDRRPLTARGPCKPLPWPMHAPVDEERSYRRRLGRVRFAAGRQIEMQPPEGPDCREIRGTTDV